MKPFTKLYGLTSFIVVLIMGLWGPAAAQDADEKAIRQLLVSSFDKPDAPLIAGPIVVQDNVSIAGWSQGDLGGRALLRRNGEIWSIALCAGDALKDAKTLESIGVPKTTAQPLAEKLSAAESGLSAQRLALFSSFDGMVEMDASGAHLQADPHHMPKP